MATESNNTDPNSEYENKVGPDHPNLSPDQLWGEKQNPVRETPEPFRNVRDGGSGSSG